MFAAFAWSAAIALVTRRTYFPSTYRLDAWAQYQTIGNVINSKPASGPYRVYVQLGEASTTIPIAPQPGDILLVGDGRPAYGDHVTLVERYDATTRLFATIEGNGVGVGPRGNRRQGVVRATRPLGARAGHSYIARRLIRPAPSDILP
jgi:hypothetical protein